MKKIALSVILIVSLGFVFVACKKDRTCTCTYSTTGNVVNSFTDVKVYLKAKKSEAKAACLSYTETVNGITTNADCSLN